MAYKFNPFTGTFDITSTPGGSNTQVQFNDSGTFSGAAQLVYEKNQGFTGFQKTAPVAPVHAVGLNGQTIAAPTGLTATLVEDVAVDRPATASTNLVYGPAIPTTPTLAIIPIDTVTSASTSQNTSFGGQYYANGQTIYYQLYCYRYVNGTYVLNSSPYTTNFTDTINDGTTTFTIDITSIGATSSYYDGFILQKSYDGFTWIASVDLGTSTSYNDNDFSGTMTLEFSAYVDYGATDAVSLYQYATVPGIAPLLSNAATGYVTGSNSGYSYIIHGNGYGTTSEEGFYVVQANYNYQDIGTDTDFYDWGGGSIGPSLSAFTDFAFPIFNTTLTGSTSTSASFNYSGGDYTADNSYWDIEVWEYRTHPLTGENWFVAAPDTYSLGFDDNSFNSMSIDWSCTPGDGDGRVVVVLQNGTPIYEEYNPSTPITGFGSVSTKPNITTYTGITRNYEWYGKVVSPSVKYSALSTNSSFTDPNLAPYMILHTLGSYGNATYLKCIENSYRIGSIYDAGAVNSYIQYSSSVGDSIVTPSTLGYLSNGANLNRTYSVYSYATAYGVTYYSSTAATTTTTDPNNGKYYKVSLAWNAVTGASYKLKRTTYATNVYLNVSTNSLVDTTANVWASTSTITPNVGPVTAGIFERAITLTSDAPQLTVRNSNNSYVSLLKFDRLSGSQYLETGRIAITPSGDFHFNTQTGVFRFGNEYSPHVTLGAQSTFNGTYTGSGFLKFQSVDNSYLLYAHSGTSTVYFGNYVGSWGADPQTTVYIQPTNSSDRAIVISPHQYGADASGLLSVITSAGSTNFLVTNNGRLAVKNGSVNNGNLYIGGGDSSNAQIQLASSSNVAVAPGGISYYSGRLYGCEGAGSPTRFAFIPSSYTAGGFTYCDGGGDLRTNNVLTYSGGALLANVQLQCVLGLALSASQNIALGIGSAIQGGIIFNYAAKSANYTLTRTDYCIDVTASGKTMTLPTAVGRTGQIYVIKATYTSSTGTVNTTSSQTIFTTSAVTSVTMNAGDTLRVMSNGSNWIAI